MRVYGSIGWIHITELKHKIRDFMRTNPSDDAIETFYCNEVLQHDKRSIVEILLDPVN
jgi:hypothetical protein